MKFGFATCDITPDGPVYMAGYAARTEPSEGVYLPLLATAMALDDGDHRLLWIGADLLGFYAELEGPVTRAVCDRCGIAPEWLLLSGSHTHCGPAFREVDASRWSPTVADLIPQLASQLADLAAAACDRLAPGTLSTVTGRSEVGVCRRLPVDGQIQMRPNPDGLMDPDVPVLLVHDAQGKLAGLQVSYACHPTTMGGQLLGPDYIGWLRVGLQEQLGDVPILFANGCGGDVKTRAVTPDGRFAGGPLSEVERCGRELARDVLAAIDGPAEPVTGPLRCLRTCIDLPFQPPQPRAVYEAAARSSNKHEQFWGEQVLARLDGRLPLESSHPFALQVVACGDDYCLVALGGEVCCGIGLAIKDRLRASGRRGQVVAYSLAMWGYQASPAQFAEGGYEVEQWWRYNGQPAAYDAGIGDRIVEAAWSLVEKVTEGD